MIKENHEIDGAIESFTKLITKAIEKAIPKQHIKSFNEPLPDEILEIINKRNRTRKLWQDTRASYLKTKLNNLNKKITKKIEEHKDNKWSEKLSKLKVQDNSLWKMTKCISKKRDSKIPRLHGPRGVKYSDAEKAQVLAENFEKVHHLTEEFGNIETEQEVIDNVLDIEQSEIDLNEIKYVSPREVAKAIKNTRPKKAPGLDGLQNIILKNLPFKAIIYLTNIFNSCFRNAYFPADWKIANVLAFPKPGKDPLFPQNYRPISLLPTLSKIFEKIILNRILEFENTHKILVQEQFGFRKSRSTVQQLARITNIISNNYNINRHTAMMLLDIEKAFDTVWHEGLFFKLNKYKIPIYIIKIIISYLKNRKFKTQVNGKFSSMQSIVAGVPQGSILGPILFLFYINDLPMHPKVRLAFFADDTALLADSWNQNQALKYLQEYVKDLEKYYNTWKIKINVAKTELIIFTRNTRKQKLSEIKMNDTIVEMKDQVKYLGVILDKKLSYTAHLKNTRNKGYAAVSQMYSLLNRKSKLSTKNKLLIHKIIIRPVLLYAAPIWSNTCKTNVKNLEIVQNKVLRMITAAEPGTSNLEIREELNVKEISILINEIATKFYKEQIKHLDILKDIGIYNHENAPFKIKYKLPHQILIKKE